jgi:plastocyanin
MPRTRWTRLIVGVFGITLVLAACSGDDGGGGTTSGTGGGTGSTTGGGGGTTITAEGFAFSPSTLQVPSGETTLTITNNDGATHTFTLDDGSVDQEVAAGESVQVTVNLTASTGFHCKIHPSMTGTLEVA